MVQLAELCVYVCVCVSCGATYRARNRFPEAHAEFMTEDVQQETFTSLHREDERELSVLQ